MTQDIFGILFPGTLRSNRVTVSNQDPTSAVRAALLHCAAESCEDALYLSPSVSAEALFPERGMKQDYKPASTSHGPLTMPPRVSLRR